MSKSKMSKSKMSKPKISIGIPHYGTQEGIWWTQLLEHMRVLAVQAEIVEFLTCGTMAADHSRNIIAQDFLKSDAEWLFWIDADTVVPVGAVARLLATGKTLASGLYYGKNPPNPPIAYYIHNGAYTPIDKQTQWEKGEILPIDAAGMGCMLTHRSVYDDILGNFQVWQREGGGLVCIHNNDVIGKIDEGAKHEHDGKVYKGQYRQRLIKPTLENWRWPFFALEHGRTEDLWFFELARRAGHKPWLDTSVECGHLRAEAFQGKDYRRINGY